MLRSLFIFLAACFCFASVAAEEKITNYDVQIEVAKSGDLLITETIEVIAEGQQIRRGIFREMPSKYTFMGVTLDYNYDLISIKRNGESENFSIQDNGNAETWRIGSAYNFLETGPHSYEIKYTVADQARRHPDDAAPRDEIYWNAIGGYWNFKIDAAQVKVTFPDGAEIIDVSGSTGARGQNEKTFTSRIQGRSAVYALTAPLAPRQGFTISTSIAPGVIAPMSEARKRELGWIRTGGPIMLGLGALGLLLYYLNMWNRFGRDPAKQPVFARYAPPEGYSAAAVHHIHNKGLRGMDALTATLMSLSIKDVLDIEAEKKTTTITSMLANRDAADLLGDERKLLDIFFGDTDGEIIMDKKSDPGFFRDVAKFHRHITQSYGKDYHRANAGWGLIGMVASLALVGFVMTQPVAKSGGIFLLILLAIMGMNILFFVLLRAPTKKGAKISAEIEGFKLYLETAETARINTANPIGEKPPAMTVDLYERFMPYALALGAEKPWTKQFETTLPHEAKTYQPSYAHGSMIDAKGGSPFNMSKALATAMTAGVAAAAPISQSSGSSGGFSSGSSGGGSSGGGGGGGGGGGW